MSLKITSPKEIKGVYQIFRSCRLCGADDDGYKMPIIQNIVELEKAEELRQKIKECAQIEVAIDDKMPLLICELCINKLNNFHAFKLLCKDTNNQTRTRLGLSPQNSQTSLSPVEKEQTPPMQASRRTRLPSPRHRKSSCPLKQHSSNRMVKNSKPVRCASSTSIPMIIKHIHTKDQDNTINYAQKAQVIDPPLAVPQKDVKQNSQNTTQDKQASILIKDTKKSKHTESSSDIGIACIATNPREVRINYNNRNTAPQRYNSNKKYKRDFCTYSSDVLGNLKTHEKTHTGEKTYKCNACEYRCSSSSNLLRHNRTHTGEMPHKCNLCDYRCTGSSSLKYHIKTHTGEKPYKCNACEYRSITRGALRRHERIHTGEKPFKCNACEYRCSSSSHLLIHKRTHTGEMPHKCNLCDYRCIGSYRLKCHIKTHTGEKPYKCNACEYRSITRSVLRKHERIHTGEKPYKCNACEFRCSFNSNLSIHKRTHTGEKPYKCNACEYRCSSNSNLLRHNRTHTG